MRWGGAFCSYLARTFPRCRAAPHPCPSLSQKGEGFPEQVLCPYRTREQRTLGRRRPQSGMALDPVSPGHMVHLLNGSRAHRPHPSTWGAPSEHPSADPLSRGERVLDDRLQNGMALDTESPDHGRFLPTTRNAGLDKVCYL